MSSQWCEANLFPIKSTKEAIMILRNYPISTERFHPWTGLTQLQRAMNEIFDRFDGRESAGHFPAINISTTEDAMTLTAELPGVTPENIEVSVEGDTFTLKGRRQAEEVGEKDTWHRRERRHGEFTRIVELPYAVDPEKVQATLRHGVLTIHLPRLEAEKPRRITISG